MASEARKLVWMGAIPLQINLHQSEVSTLPPPPPFMVLAPRNSYLPLLVPSMKSHFQSALPPGSDTVWFDYQGLPLKWHIPTGVLFDLLCAEPERPWSLMVHFRTYPSELLSPCGEDAVKWNFINSLKEASYIMYGSTKGVMNMSQSDQLDLWRSVVKGDPEAYDHFSLRLKPSSGVSSGGASAKSFMRRQSLGEMGTGGSDAIKPESGSLLPGKMGFRLYIRQVKGNITDILDSPPLESWDSIMYITRPVEIFKDDGTVSTLGEALNKVAPQLFITETSASSEKAHSCNAVNPGDSQSTLIFRNPSPLPNTIDRREAEAVATSSSLAQEEVATKVQEVHTQESKKVVNKSYNFNDNIGQHQIGFILRIQGIEPSLDLPLDWLVQNLCGPEQFVHVCISILEAYSSTEKSE